MSKTASDVNDDGFADLTVNAVDKAPGSDFSEILLFLEPTFTVNLVLKNSFGYTYV